MYLDGTWIRRATSTAAILALMGVGLVGPSGCAWGDDAAYRARLENTGKPALHAVHGARLRKLMLRLNALMFERQRTQVDIDADRRRYADETAKTAGDLLETVGYIGMGDDLDLDPSDRPTFEGLRAKLERQLGTLREAALRYEVDALQPQFNAIVSTCNACHSAFRDQKEPTP